MAHLGAIAPAACVARAGASSLLRDHKKNNVFARRIINNNDNDNNNANRRRVVVTAAATTTYATGFDQSTRHEEKKGAGWVSDELPDEVDVCIIGAGIGGLSCAALLGKYGVSVAVAEAHTVAGGAAHGFHRGGYEFDSGPSYFLGLSSPPGESINGLRQVLDAVGETVEAVEYNRLKFYLPEGEFTCAANRECYRDAIRRFAGEDAVAEWDSLEEAMAPLGEAAVAIPFAGMRADAGVMLTMAKYVAPLVKALGGGPKAGGDGGSTYSLRLNSAVFMVLESLLFH